MSEARLRLDGVGFAYTDGPWRLSVDGLAFGVERMVCIVGPNGSGKSTLLRLAAGILAPREGSVTLDGRPLAGLGRRAIARRLGFLPQETPALFDYSVEEVAGMGRYAHLRGAGVMTAADRRAVARALDAVDMTGLRERPLSHLSGGERRRALIASVLAQEPELLLLDEPTGALDMHHAAAVMRLLSDVGGSGPAVVLVTHDVNLAALFGDRLLLLAEGRVAADGAAADVVRPGIMRRAYGEDVLVRTHPESGGPLIVPRRRVPAGPEAAHA
ncbi:MAG: ABC transporter ATP-binding protein [Lentisphaerae bacterium]|nr:ABC transporter ATP-binding protein [Lentisphaerota bacterium]